MESCTIIVTDLDGTLLDGESYSFEAAQPALDLVRRFGIPLILCSSKTRAEIEVYRRRLSNEHPFIAENGGGIYLPGGYFPAAVRGEELDGYEVIALGLPYTQVRRSFEQLRRDLQVPVRGFGDMTEEEVATVTGLSKEEARLARQRDYGEPFIFLGEPDERFLRAIEAAGLTWTQGRLFHIMGNHDKGKAVHLLRELYAQDGTLVELIALGDSLNDLPLLLAADRRVLVRRPDGSHDPRVDLPGLLRTKGIGPQGWNEAVLGMLKDRV
jgi:mannosyl-3-phosphoglycerate phosphatase family protein